jgi:4-carboxymuconolactone decarboxylase
MTISETANKNHEALFPNRKSTLKVTDPELIEVFDNFAFDEVLGYGNLDTRTRLMVILASRIRRPIKSIFKNIYRRIVLVIT